MTASRYHFHPACLLFPELGKDELEELAEDIRARGLLQDIVTYKGKILDGRNRLAACEIAGVKPRFVEWKGEGSPVEWVISENLIRRHLTSSQRAVVALELLPLLEKEAKERQRLGQGRGKKVAKVQATSSGQGKASQLAARLTKTNSTYVEAVKAVQKQAPELIDQIRSGAMKIPEARSLATLPKPKRAQAVKMTANGQASSISHAVAKLRSTDAEAARNGKMASPPVIHHQDAIDFLSGLKPASVDLLLTDPPFMTDVKNVGEFASKWVPLALSRVKPTGRAFIFTGAYPEELHAYLTVLLQQRQFKVGNVMVWSYRNTLGLRSPVDYHTNWQAIFHVRGPKAPMLQCPEMTEHFAVQEISAPDGRHGTRLHKWQKPDELALGDQINCPVCAPINCHAHSQPGARRT